jgi:branched-chain amino acid transport system permease protein
LWGFVFSLIALGITLIYGMMGLVNFANGELLMVAMYIGYWLSVKPGIDPMISLPFTVIVLGAMGFLVYHGLIKHVLKAPMFAQMVSTFGLMVFLQGLAQFLWTTEYRTVKAPMLTGVWKVGGIAISKPQTITSVAAIVAAVVVYLFIMKTKTGWSILAVSQDKDAAALMGISVQKAYTIVWVIGAALVGFAGALLVEFYYVYPSVGELFAKIAYVTVALGGFGSIEGAFLAGIIIGMLDSIIGFLLPPSLKPVIIFSLYLVVIAFRPRGLMGRT